MDSIDPGLGGDGHGSDGAHDGSRRGGPGYHHDADDRGQHGLERAYRDRRGYGDHGQPGEFFEGQRPARSVADLGRRERSSRSPFAILGVVVILVAIGAGWFLTRDRTKQIEIAEGDDAAAVAAKLYEQNDQIDQTEVVNLIEGPGPAIIPGTYTLDDELTTVDQVRALQADWVTADPGITFPEGFTVDKIAARIAANRWQYTADGLVAASEGLTVDPRVQRPADITSTEGLLFPSTYSVGNEIENSKTMGQMLVTMQDILFDQLDIEGAAQRLNRTPYQLVIIASLIEKEAKTEGDRAQISRVIHNRIDRDMLLQIDASMYYQAPEDATFSDLKEADSPYNLYITKGLPPTPIANPGRLSLEAALNPAPPLDPSDERCADMAPEDCALLFYVLSDSEGNHAFAVTNEQHEANIEAAKQAGVL